MINEYEKLEKRINELENVRALRELVDNFSILADKKEAQAQALLFTEDATVETIVGGNSQGVLKGRKAIGDTFEQFLNTLEIVYHSNAQHVVSIYGNKAEGTLYCMAYLINSEDDKKMKSTMAVHYNDEYVYENGQWLIAKRTSYFEFQERQELK